jgi:hypothetical protein
LVDEIPGTRLSSVCIYPIPSHWTESVQDSGSGFIGSLGPPVGTGDEDTFIVFRLHIAHFEPSRAALTSLMR